MFFSLANKSKEASTCRREAAALTVQCLPGTVAMTDFRRWLRRYKNRSYPKMLLGMCWCYCQCQDSHVNRVAEKSLKVKSEWVVHQAHFGKKNERKSARSSPAHRIKERSRFLRCVRRWSNRNRRRRWGILDRRRSRCLVLGRKESTGPCGAQTPKSMCRRWCMICIRSWS